MAELRLRVGAQYVASLGYSAMWVGGYRATGQVGGVWTWVYRAQALEGYEATGLRGYTAQGYEATGDTVILRY